MSDSLSMMATTGLLGYGFGEEAFRYGLEMDLDFIAAGKISADAVRANLKPMLLWGGLIALFTAAGIATFFIGLILSFPLIGHATWHAYRALVPPEAD